MINYQNAVELWASQRHTPEGKCIKSSMLSPHRDQKMPLICLLKINHGASIPCIVPTGCLGRPGDDWQQEGFLEVGPSPPNLRRGGETGAEIRVQDSRHRQQKHLLWARLCAGRAGNVPWQPRTKINVVGEIINPIPNWGRRLRKIKVAWRKIPLELPLFSN